MQFVGRGTAGVSKARLLSLATAQSEERQQSRGVGIESPALDQAPMRWTGLEREMEQRAHKRPENAEEGRQRVRRPILGLGDSVA